MILNRFSAEGFFSVSFMPGVIACSPLELGGKSSRCIGFTCTIVYTGVDYQGRISGS